MTPYNEGLVSYLTGSNIITGSDTYWSRQVKAGDKLIISPASFYIVIEVTDDSHLKTHAVIAEESAEDSAYIIARDSAEWGNNIDIAQDLTDLLGKYQLGITKGVQDTLAAKQGAAEARSAAETARDTALVYSNSSSESASASETSRRASQAAQAAAETARDNALLAKSGAEAAQGFAESARDRAVQAESAAVSAKNTAESKASEVDVKTSNFNTSLSTAQQAEAAALAALQQIQQAVAAGDPSSLTWDFLETQLAGALYYDRTNNVIRLKGDPLTVFTRQNHFYGTGADGTLGWHLIPGQTATEVTAEREEDYLDTGGCGLFACLDL